MVGVLLVLCAVTTRPDADRVEYLIEWFRLGPVQWAAMTAPPMIRGSITRYYGGDGWIPAYALESAFDCEGDGYRYRFCWDGEVMNEDSRSVERFKLATAFDGDYDTMIQHGRCLFVEEHQQREELLPYCFGYHYKDKFISDLIGQWRVDGMTVHEGRDALVLVVPEGDGNEGGDARRVFIVPDLESVGMFSYLREERNGRVVFEAHVRRKKAVNGLSIAVHGEWTAYRYTIPGSVFMSLFFEATEVTSGTGDYRLQEYRQRTGQPVSLYHDASGREPATKSGKRAMIVRRAEIPWAPITCSSLGAFIIVMIARRRVGRAAVVVLLPLLQFACARVADQRPLVVEPDPLDLGIVGQHEVRDFSFHVRNKTEETWRLVRMRKSCGCVILADSPKAVDPLSLIEVRAQLDSGKNEGPFRQTLYLTYVSRNTEVEVPVISDVTIRRIVEVAPQLCSATCFEGETVQRELVFSGEGVLSALSVADSAAVSDGPLLEVATPLPMRISGGAATVCIRVTGRRPGLYSGHLTAEFEGCIQRRRKIEYTAQVRAGIEVNPCALTIRGGDWGEAAISPQVGAVGVDTRVLRASSPECLEVEFSVLAHSPGGRIRVRHRSGEPPPRCPGNLHKIAIEYGGGREVKIPVVVRL